MNHGGKRLVNNPVTGLTNAKSQIGVFIISGSKSFVKTIQLIPEFCGNSQRRAGTIIGISQEIELRPVRVFKTAVIPAAAVIEYNPARLLKRTVGID